MSAPPSPLFAGKRPSPEPAIERVIGLLDNVVWHALSGEHACFSTGDERARRYASGFSPIAGFADATDPDVDALAPFCEPGEHLYCEGWPGGVPEGWTIDVEKTMVKMLWDRDMPADDATDAVRLGREHAAQALALADLNRPGPFGPRTIELGEYFGLFDGERLVAMAGERMRAGALREISGVCTHPDFQGRGFARRLMTKLPRRQMERAETPFLHVMSDNAVARGLYEAMGFRTWREGPVRVISRR